MLHSTAVSTRKYLELTRNVLIQVRIHRLAAPKAGSLLSITGEVPVMSSDLSICRGGDKQLYLRTGTCAESMLRATEAIIGWAGGIGGLAGLFVAGPLIPARL